MARLWLPFACLLLLAAPAASALAPYKLTVVAPLAKLDVRAPADALNCAVTVPATLASRGGSVRVINIVKDRYFLKFFDGGRLPRMITQQQDVPRALVVDSGVWRLPELVRAVGDAKVLSGDHVLGLPLLIRPGAAVVIDNGAWLKLDRMRGAFILNLGELQVRDARLTAWEAATRKPARLRSPSYFRPYVLGWGGSRTVIHHSLVEGLGFSEHLSGGLGFARGPFGLKGLEGNRAPEAWLTRNRIIDAWTALRISGGPVRVCGNVVDGSHAHGIQVEDSSGPVRVVGNHLHGVRNGNAISMTATSGAWVAGNIIEDNAQSGLVLAASRGAWLVGNTARRNRSDGLRLQGSGATVIDTVSSQNGDHGLQVRDGAHVRIQGFVATGNGGAGIEATRQAETRLAAGTRWQLLLADANLVENRGGAIGMDRPYEMVLGDIRITDTSSVRRALLRSGLNGVEGPLLKAVLVDKRYLRVAH